MATSGCQHEHAAQHVKSGAGSGAARSSRFRHFLVWAHDLSACQQPFEMKTGAFADSVHCVQQEVGRPVHTCLRPASLFNRLAEQ